MRSSLELSALFFLPTLEGGGAEMNAVRLAGGLLEHGITPVYAVARGPGSYARHLPNGVEVVVLDTGGIGSSTLRLLRAVGPLARLIQARRPDVVVPVLPGPALAALTAARRARHRPRVALSIQNRLLQANHAVDHIEMRLVRTLFPGADRVIALSRGVAEEVAAAVPALRKRIDVVHNVGLPLPAQLAVAEPDIAPPPPGRLRYIACGRLVPQKGFDVLLEAFARVAAEHDAELHILGQGPLQGRLEAEAERLGVLGRVRFLGFRANPFVHMQVADVFVLSSLWEGFGNVIVEAMAMGTPVIATRCAHGPDEIITDGENGLLVPPTDAGELAEAMLRLGRAPDLRARLAAAGEARARDFSAERIAGEFASVLRKLVCTPAHPP